MAKHEDSDGLGTRVAPLPTWHVGRHDGETSLLDVPCHNVGALTMEFVVLTIEGAIMGIASCPTPTWKQSHFL